MHNKRRINFMHACMQTMNVKPEFFQGYEQQVADTGFQNKVSNIIAQKQVPIHIDLYIYLSNKVTACIIEILRKTLANYKHPGPKLLNLVHSCLRLFNQLHVYCYCTCKEQRNRLSIARVEQISQRHLVSAACMHVQCYIYTILLEYILA